ncbi:hypothetical protein [Nocardia brasiliensis]|uniref:Glycine rich protein n=1 Tax=Nocardia brasiliensis (strain ATCC 700358 / HUJEG-1) TaxID=1133849 RepID=K0EQ87_NOCB7|nr:hypothetical protein [Nocardia brasiliensis]AFT99138.1 hypothetical protein O3I_005880 [Nocardia brasiliensis ATCC 700358]OCF85035.1 hypothetical protein AW168_37985 [Nocardia brasiliensis]
MYRSSKLIGLVALLGAAALGGTGLAAAAPTDPGVAERCARKSAGYADFKNCVEQGNPGGELDGQTAGPDKNRPSGPSERGGSDHSGDESPDVPDQSGNAGGRSGNASNQAGNAGNQAGSQSGYAGDQAGNAGNQTRIEGR